MVRLTLDDTLMSEPESGRISAAVLIEGPVSQQGTQLTDQSGDGLSAYYVVNVQRIIPLTAVLPLTSHIILSI